MCTPFTISYTAVIFGLLGLISVIGIWKIHQQLSSAFSLKLDYRRINKQTLEKELPILNEMLAKESVTWSLQVQIKSAHQLYLDAINILNGPNNWTNKHHRGGKTMKLFRRHDDADRYLARAAGLITQLHNRLADQIPATA